MFDGEARTLEFDEPFFWHVRVTRPATPAHRGGFWEAFNSDIHRVLTSESETLAEILKKNGTQNILYEREFSTREDALNHYHEAVRTIREHQRTGRPEHAQMLLAALADWCSEQRGRQTQVARAIDASSQAVNDWLNARKKMTAEQALRIAAFLYEQGLPIAAFFILKKERRKRKSQ